MPKEDPKQEDRNGSVNRRQRVQSAETGVAVLKMLAAMGGAATLTALSARLGENPAKVHRYLATLVEAGFVYQEAGSGRYVLGTEAIVVGLAAIRQSDPLAYSAPELTALSEAFNVSCFTAVLGNRGPTIVRWEEPVQPVVVNVQVGSVMPILWSATGRAFGAFAKSDQIAAYAQLELQAASAEQRKLLPNMKAVEALFAEIRAQGCAPVRDVLLPGISAIAAPIFDANARLAAVITVLGVSGSFDPDPAGPVAEAIIRRAAAVSTRLGFMPEPSISSPPAP